MTNRDSDVGVAQVAGAQVAGLQGCLVLSGKIAEPPGRGSTGKLDVIVPSVAGLTSQLSQKSRSPESERE